MWVLFSIKTSSFVFHYLRHPASRVSFFLLEWEGEKKAAVLKASLTSVTGLNRGLRYTTRGSDAIFKVIHWPVVSWSWAQVNFLKVEFSLLSAYVRSIINWGGHFPKHPSRASLLALAKCVYYIYKSREWKGHSIATNFSTHSACHLLDPRWNKTTFPSASVSTAVTWPSFTFAGLFPGQSAVSSSRNTDSSSSQDGAHSKIAHRRLWKMQTHLVTGVGGKNAGLFW